MKQFSSAQSSGLWNGTPTTSSRSVRLLCPACQAGGHEDPAFSDAGCECPCHGTSALVTAGGRTFARPVEEIRGELARHPRLL